jgi:hypothetical protein
VIESFSGKEPDYTTTYLGFFMPKGRVLVRHYRRQEERVESRLGRGWKMHILFHVGRLALTRHVLLAYQYITW